LKLSIRSELTHWSKRQAEHYVVRQQIPYERTPLKEACDVERLVALCQLSRRQDPIMFDFSANGVSVSNSVKVGVGLPKLFAWLLLAIIHIRPSLHWLRVSTLVKMTRMHSRRFLPRRCARWTTYLRIHTDCVQHLPKRKRADFPGRAIVKGCRQVSQVC
jgi:hypothetical protein